MSLSWQRQLMPSDITKPEWLEIVNAISDTDEREAFVIDCVVRGRVAVDEREG